MLAKRDSMTVRSAVGIPRLTPQPMASDTARFGTIRHIERRARSLKESPPMEVFGSNYGLLRTSNLRSARKPRQRPKVQSQSKRPPSPSYSGKAAFAGLPEVRNPTGSVRRRFGTRLRVLNLVVEVQRELVGVRAQTERVHLVLT